MSEVLNQATIMSAAIRRIFLSAVLLLSLACVHSGDHSRSTPMPSPWLGKEISLTAIDLRTEKPRGLDGFAGDVVLVDFSASWCLPCKEATPFYNQLLSTLGERGFSVVGVSVDIDREVALRGLTEVPASFPVLWDRGQVNVSRFDITEMPTAFLLDRNGVVAHVYCGFFESTKIRLKRDVEALLGQ